MSFVLILIFLLGMFLSYRRRNISRLCFIGCGTKMALYFFGDNFYNIKESFKIFSPQILRRHLIFWTEHLSISGITSHGTESFRVKPITPGHPIPKISTRLTIFWGSKWKTESVKIILRQERTSSEEKSDGFHQKCSTELWTILMFELLCCHTAVRRIERT